MADRRGAEALPTHWHSPASLGARQTFNKAFCTALELLQQLSLALQAARAGLARLKVNANLVCHLVLIALN